MSVTRKTNTPRPQLVRLAEINKTPLLDDDGGDNTRSFSLTWIIRQVDLIVRKALLREHLFQVVAILATGKGEDGNAPHDLPFLASMPAF